MNAQPNNQGNDDDDDTTFEELLDESSLGAPNVDTLRALTPLDEAKWLDFMAGHGLRCFPAGSEDDIVD